MDNANRLLQLIQTREARIGIVGLGYVGLPLAMTFADAGFRVVGIDKDRSKLEKIRGGQSYIRYIPSSQIAEHYQSGRFTVASDFSEASTYDCIIICVPTPLTAAREPDMSFIVATARGLAPHVRPSQLFSLESTTYTGTTEELLKPILESGGLRAGEDFFLAFSPEREDPGNPKYNTKSIPKIVGGYTPSCLQVADALYKSALTTTVPVSSTRVAELVKLLENIYRCVNIALVNEMKLLCDRMGIDVWEVISAAATKPFGYQPFAPGPGVGGHCIPIDPFYLTWKAREFNFQTKFIELAGEINSAMPAYVVQRTTDVLNDSRKCLNGAKLLALGVAYKKDLQDLRESPALEVISLLQRAGAHVEYHDPFIPLVEREHDPVDWGERQRDPRSSSDQQMRSVELTDEALAAADLVLILTDHSGIDYERVVVQSKHVVDTRNATRDIRAELRHKVTKA